MVTIIILCDIISYCNMKKKKIKENFVEIYFD